MCGSVCVCMCTCYICLVWLRNKTFVSNSINSPPPRLLVNVVMLLSNVCVNKKSTIFSDLHEGNGFEKEEGNHGNNGHSVDEGVG